MSNCFLALLFLQQLGYTLDHEPEMSKEFCCALFHLPNRQSLNVCELNLRSTGDAFVLRSLVPHEGATYLPACASARNSRCLAFVL